MADYTGFPGKSRNIGTNHIGEAESVMSPTKLAIIYSVASLFIGPLVFLLGYSLTRGGGDYCDSVYYLPDGSLDPQRSIEFRNAQIFQVVGAGIMLLLGLLIVINLFRDGHKNREKLNILTFLVVALVILGYVFVILFSGHGGQTC